ncbi:MAG: hypothetical protein JWR72_1859 [Flavisolibacter sp.]|jgi:hypothetical protein|nr:hypothetical protein [Flavisolibacter sp.]
MKKSNKLLLGGFLTGLLLITAIHVTLYAKYKAGDYTVYNAEGDLASQSMQTFPNILFVSVRNVPDATVKFSDVAGVEKVENPGVVYVRRGDTLLITGTDSTNNHDFDYRVALNLPHNATLSVFNSFLSFKTGKKTAESNPIIYLQKSQAIFSGAETPVQFGHLKVFASGSSTATFRGNTQINNLEVQLSHSSIEYTDGNFDQLSIVTDSVSRISLQSKHLLKANIKTIASQ